MFSKLIDQIKEDKFLIIIPLLTILTRLIIFGFIPHTYEDAFITFRYAENFANGNGLVYNIGEHVYGTTTPLFALFLGIFKYLGVSCIISSLSINLISEGITSAIVYKFLKDYSKGILAVLVSFLYVFSPSNISWSIQGMETAFFTALIAMSFYSLYKNKYFLALLFGSFGAVLRIDGLSIPIVIFIFIFVKQRFAAFKYLILPLIILLIWEFFLYIYFNSFLPNSMIAKLVLYAGHQKSIFPNLELIFSKFFLMGYYSSSIITILFVAGIFLIIKQQLNLVPMIVWFIIYYAALILSKTDIFAWYLIPPLFVFISISGIAIIFVAKQAIKYFQSNFPVVIILLGIIFFSSITLYIKIVQIKDEYSYERNVRVKVGEFLDDSTSVYSTVFLEPIGIIGYFSHRYIYDDAALISPQFLELNKLSNTPETSYKKIQMVRPDYLVIRNRYIDEFYSKTNLKRDYKPIKSFKFDKDFDLYNFPYLTIFARK